MSFPCARRGYRGGTAPHAFGEAGLVAVVEGVPPTPRRCRRDFGVSWLLVLFLVPVTFTMHKFWAVADLAAAQDQMAHFMKNLSMLGGALLISQVGAGPESGRPEFALMGRLVRILYRPASIV